MDRFQKIIWDLSEETHLILQPDKNNACKILLDEKFAIQLELDPHEEKLVIIALICEIPPGKFRENVLREALKINSTYHPYGTFAYIEKTNTLALQQSFLIESIQSDKLAEFLELFVEEADLWHAAIQTGAPVPIKYSTQKYK